MIRRWRRARRLRRELREFEAGCHGHSHSMFRTCRNGLTMVDYLILVK